MTAKIMFSLSKPEIDNVIMILHKEANMYLAIIEDCKKKDDYGKASQYKDKIRIIRSAIKNMGGVLSKT